MIPKSRWQNLLSETNADILINIRNCSQRHARNIARDLSREISNTQMALIRMEKKGWITREKEGRRKIARLTEKGEKIAEALRDIKELIGK